MRDEITIKLNPYQIRNLLGLMLRTQHSELENGDFHHEFIAILQMAIGENKEKFQNNEMNKNFITNNYGDEWYIDDASTKFKPLKLHKRF